MWLFQARSEQMSRAAVMSAGVAVEGEVYLVGRGVFLVVGHQLKQAGIVGAGYGVAAIMGFYELCHGVEMRRGVAEGYVAEYEFYYQSPRHGIAMGYGLLALKGECLEGVAGGVAQVESFARAGFLGVGGHDVGLHLDVFAQQVEQAGSVGGIVAECTRQRFVAAQKSVLEHLGISAQHLVGGKRGEEHCADDSGHGLSECANLVFQSVEVYAGLAADGCIDGTEQGSGHIYVRHSALECRGYEAAEVGDNAAAHVYYHRRACGAPVAEALPQGHGGIQIFLGIACLDGEHRRAGNGCRRVAQFRQAGRCCVYIHNGEYRLAACRTDQAVYGGAHFIGVNNLFFHR